MKIKSYAECEKIFTDFGYKYDTHYKRWKIKFDKYDSTIGTSWMKLCGKEVENYSFVDGGYGTSISPFNNGWVQTCFIHEDSNSAIRLPVEFFNTLQGKLDKILED